MTSNSTDSIVKFSDLNFRNDFEANYFKEYQKKGIEADIINLFLSSYLKNEGFNSLKAHEQINDCVLQLKKETQGLSQEKIVKEIYKYVHKRFFKLYKLQNSFSDIFETGEYNCVSGSAMYAIIFQLMNIPYQIIEAPSHVFLIAYPQTHKIFIETTIPEGGYFSFNEEYVQKYINHMRDSKLISQEEFGGSTANELFNKYYFLQNGLTIFELAGIQYSNYAVYYSKESDYEKASIEIKKAYFLASNQRHKYMLLEILKYNIGNRNYQKEDDVKNLAVLCRYNDLDDKEISDERLKHEFGRLLQSQLINQSDYELADRSYKIVTKEIKDTALNKEIAFYYHYELARLGFVKLKDKDYEMEHLKSAYIANNKNADIQQLITSYLGRLVEVSNNAVTIMKLLKEFSGNFNYLKEDAAYNSVKANCFLEMAYEHLMLNEISKGESYISEFEKLSANSKDIKAGERFIEKAYSTLATYYYKKGNTSKTKQLLKKGIEYAPDNFGLKIRLDQIH